MNKCSREVCSMLSLSSSASCRIAYRGEVIGAERRSSTWNVDGFYGWNNRQGWNHGVYQRWRNRRAVYGVE
jgi:hypothetical protein